jgi:hypothetical protein
MNLSARGFVLTKIILGRMDMENAMHKLVEEARTWVLAMNVSQAMISSKDTQSALEATWNKIDEKKLKSTISLRLQPLKKKGGLEGGQ